MTDNFYDVVVVGGGNAALCAALASNEGGASVLVLERAPEEECGGNSRYTSGSLRFPYNSVDDLRSVLRDLTDAELARLDFGTYSEADFFDDMFRVTNYRTDPQLCTQIVTKSYEAAPLGVMVNARRGSASWTKERTCAISPMRNTAR
jgi:tricarballylate dehydrogenase